MPDKNIPETPDNNNRMETTQALEPKLIQLLQSEEPINWDLAIQLMKGLQFNDLESMKFLDTYLPQGLTACEFLELRMQELGLKFYQLKDLI